MPSRACIAFRALCSIAFVIAAAATGFSQSPAKGEAKRSVADVLRERASGDSFVLITPSELASLSALTSGGDPCDVALEIGYGQTLMGDLTLFTDCQLPDGSYADFYTFTGEQGVGVTINLTSPHFDTYLGLANMSGTFIIEDDDGGDGTNSRIIATLPETGTYVILANSVLPMATGTYFVGLQRNPPCTFTLAPPSTIVPPEGGTFTFDLVTQPGCHWTASSNSYPAFRIVGMDRGYGSATITYSALLNNTGSTTHGTITAGGQTFSISQPTIPCSYSISPQSVDMPGAETYGQFTVTTGPNCLWTSFNNDFFIWIDSPSSRMGSGTVDFHVIANNGAERTGTVSVATHTFTVRQAGLNCTFSVSPTVINVPAIEWTGSLAIDTQAGCFWLLNGNASIVQMGQINGAGPTTVNYRMFANPGQTPRSTTFTLNSGVAPPIVVTFNQAAPGRRSAFDFDGDGKTDIGIFRPSVAEWWINRSSTGATFAAQFGATTDEITPADYTGDGKTDIAFWRPSSGEWYVLRSEDNSFYAVPFGASGDIPAPADYDADGKADTAVFRPSTATWYISRSSGGTTIQQFGANGDQPVAADYDGDGRTDIAIYRPSNGQWWINRSTAGVLAVSFGESNDKAVQGDYTGDGKADVAFWRPSTGEWYILRSEDSSYYSVPFGVSTDMPAPGDYDGDGRHDLTVFRPSTATWYSNRSTAGTVIQQFGAPGDRPVPNAFVP
jgi:hypothetical protein